VYDDGDAFGHLGFVRRRAKMWRPNSTLYVPRDWRYDRYTFVPWCQPLKSEGPPSCARRGIDKANSRRGSLSDIEGANAGTQGVGGRWQAGAVSDRQQQPRRSSRDEDGMDRGIIHVGL
jgi:hypothetical protein